jgi:TetR/AcrR family transcriptional regulator, lmrAB and yxaGH operons repressor
MARKTISDDEMMERALDLFRTYGFEGVSLRQLAETMGLEKASLYYRFPGGKEEIALAVVQAVDAGIREAVFKPLYNEALSPKRRVQLACEGLREFYGGGTKPCTLDVMSIAGRSTTIGKVLSQTLRDWETAFAAVSASNGVTPREARERAEEAILRLEGALILSRVKGDVAPFERVLKQLPTLLTSRTPFARSYEP